MRYFDCTSFRSIWHHSAPLCKGGCLQGRLIFTTILIIFPVILSVSWRISRERCSLHLISQLPLIASSSRGNLFLSFWTPFLLNNPTQKKRHVSFYVPLLQFAFYKSSTSWSGSSNSPSKYVPVQLPSGSKGDAIGGITGNTFFVFFFLFFISSP